MQPFLLYTSMWIHQTNQLMWALKPFSYIWVFLFPPAFVFFFFMVMETQIATCWHHGVTDSPAHHIHLMVFNLSSVLSHKKTQSMQVQWTTSHTDSCGYPEFNNPNLFIADFAALFIQWQQKRRKERTVTWFGQADLERYVVWLDVLSDASSSSFF